MDSTVLRTIWLLLFIFVTFADGKLEQYNSYSYDPKFRYVRPPSVAPFQIQPFSPPKAAYFVGTYSAHSEPLEWRKPWNLYSFSELKRAKIRSPKIHRPRPPVDISFGRDPPVTLLNKDRPSSTAPPVYEINHEGEFYGKPKPSLGINEFSQVQQREPTAVNFGFLPVFPWPDKIPKRVSHLFPKSGENEVGWRVPQVDDRLSHFPHAVDNRRNIITTTMPPSTPEKNNNIWNPKTLTNPPTFPTLVQNGDQNFQLQFERVTTPPPTTVSSSTSSPTTTSNPNSNSRSQNPDLNTSASNSVSRTSTSDSNTSAFNPRSTSQRNIRTTKPNSWTQVPRKAKSSFVLKEKKKFFSPRPGKFDYKRVQGAPSQYSNKQYTDFKCRALDPFMDSVPHPHTDPSCEQGFPGWQKDPNCRCTFVVASRNFLGCATKFHTLCWRV